MSSKSLLLVVSACLVMGRLHAVDRSGVKPQSVVLPTGPGGYGVGLGETFRIQSNTGASSYAIPLQVPPGRAGHSPKLALEYSSALPNGPLGIGWRLNIPAIERKTEKGQPQYGQGEREDTYTFEGEELVRLTDGSFRTENEAAFSRFMPSGDGWEVREKSGRILHFGQYPNSELPDRSSRQAVPGSAGNFNSTYSWRLDSIEDVSGNLIELLYEEQADSPGALYLKEVRYNLHSTIPAGERNSSPQHALVFVYEPRPDAFSDYRSGFEIRTARRCTEIRVESRVQPLLQPPAVVRKYALGYQPETPSGAEEALPLARSLLHSVTQLDAKDNPLPPLRITYTGLELVKPDRFSVHVVEGSPYVSPQLADGDADFADIDGDALPDILLTEPASHSVAFNLGHDRFGPIQRFSNPVGVPGVTLTEPGVQLLDIDGDGRIDLVHRRGGGAVEAGVAYRQIELVPDPRSESGYQVRWGKEQYFDRGLAFGLESANVRLLDVDGDKTIDVLRSDDVGVRAIRNVVGSSGRRRWVEEAEIPYGFETLGGLTQGFEAQDGRGSRPNPNLHFADMNGDRLLDLVDLHVDGTFVQVRYRPNRGCGRLALPRPVRYTAGGRDFAAIPTEVEPGEALRLADVTGDGLADLLFPSSGVVRLWVNLGGDRYSAVQKYPIPEYAGDTRIREADMNGDGTTDLVIWSPAAPAGERLRYLDFVAGQRPNLLTTVDNGLGCITTVEYRSTVDYYLAAREAGESWERPLPVALPVVSRLLTTPSLDLDRHVELDGHSSNDQYITEYYYRDGYYDGFEKEFRGFAQAMRVELGDDRYGDLIDSGRVHTPTTVTRYRFHTGAPNGLDDDGDGFIDEVNEVAGREEEPLKGRPVWTEVTALDSGTPGYAAYDSGGDRRPEWLRLVRTGADDGADNDVDGQVDEPDEKQFADDALVYSREIKTWNLTVIHSSTKGPALVPFTTVMPEREVRFAFEEQTDKLVIEGPNRRLLGSEAAQAPVRATRSAHEFDDFGNVTVVFEHGIYPDTPEFDDERQNRTEYALGGVAINRWILDRVSRAQVTDETGKVISEKRILYGDSDTGFDALSLGEVSRQALLKEESSLLVADTSVGKAGADTKLIMDNRLAYDIYGNTVVMLDPLGNPAQPQDGHARELEYDPTFHTFPITEKLHVGKDASGNAVPPLLMRASYDIAFGALTATTDFNLAPVSQFLDVAVGTDVPGTRRSVAGNVMRFVYDSFGRLAKIVKPGDTEDFPTSLFAYIHADPSRDLVYVYDPQGNLVGGDAQFVTARVSLGGLNLDFGSDASAVVTVAREQHGVASGLVSIQYTDGAGHKLAQVSESETPAAFVVKESTLYDSRGQTARVFQPYLSPANWGLAPSDVLFAERFRDPAGRVVKSLSPPDSGGVRDVTSSLYLPFEERQFDEDDNRDGTGGRPRSPFVGTFKALFNDGLGRLIRVHETARIDDEGTPVADLRTWPTRYAYDLLGNLTEVLDSQNNRKQLRYDSLKRKTRLDDADRGVLSFTYDDASNVLETVDAKAQHNVFTYDGVNRLLTEDYGDEGNVFSHNFAFDPTKPLTASNRPDVAYFYDSPVASLDQGDGSVDTATNVRGMLASVWDLSGEEHTSFDARGRAAWTVKRVRDPMHGGLVSYRTGFTYDALDRVTGITYPDNDAVGYEYNARNLLLRITGGQAGGLSPDNTIISSIAYKASGQQAEIRYGNGVRTTYVYDPRLRLKELLTVAPAVQQSRELIHFGYEFDGVSNIGAIRDLRPAASVSEGDPRRNTQVFSYDDLYRLTGVQYSFNLPGNAVRNDGVITYRYDRIGNMLEQSSTLDHREKGLSVANLGLMESGGSAGGRRNRVGRVAGGLPGPHALNRITNPAFPARNYVYDDNGNMTLIDGLVTSYDFKDRLVLAESDEMRAEYTYDHTDRRILKRVEWKKPIRADGTRPVAPLTHVVYVGKHFEVRDNDIPTKYIWNGETRVARVTGTLSSNARVQRIRARAGWNLVSVAVSAPRAFVDQIVVVEEVYRWRAVTLDWAKVAPADNIPAGTVLWVRARGDGTLTLAGVYPGLQQVLRARPAGTFLPGRGLEALQLDTQSAEILAWYFDGGAQSWRMRLTPPLDMLPGFPMRLAPGEALFVAAVGAEAVELKRAVGAGSIAYYHQDHLGSTSFLGSLEPNDFGDMNNFPFGYSRSTHRPVVKVDHNLFDYHFAQKEKDSGSNLEYFEYRYLFASHGRFVNPDPLSIEAKQDGLLLPQKLNPYSYAMNNPITITDPSGLDNPGCDVVGDIFQHIFNDPYSDAGRATLQACAGHDYRYDRDHATMSSWGANLSFAATGAMVGSALSGGGIGAAKDGAILGSLAAGLFSKGAKANNIVVRDVLKANLYHGKADPNKPLYYNASMLGPAGPNKWSNARPLSNANYIKVNTVLPMRIDPVPFFRGVSASADKSSALSSAQIERWSIGVSDTTVANSK